MPSFFEIIGQLKLWQRMFQPIVGLKKQHDLDWQLKTDKRSDDLIKTESKKTKFMLYNVDDFLHNIHSQMYPFTKIGYTWMQRRDL